MGAFFNDFAQYKKKATDHAAKLTKSPSKKEPVDGAGVSLDTTVVCSRMTHLAQIELRLDFLRFFLHNSSLVLSPSVFNGRILIFY